MKPMLIGHINLARSLNGTSEHFVRLIEALDRQGVRQHVLAANAALAKRLAICEQVQLGPLVRSWVMACCLMPEVDVVHVHDRSGRRAGLALRLTRSMRYVLSRRETEPLGVNPIDRSILLRASGVICASREAASPLRGTNVVVDTLEDLRQDLRHENGDEMSENRVAAEHVRIYRRATDSRRIPALLL